MRTIRWCIIVLLFSHSLSAIAQTGGEKDILLDDAKVKTRRKTRSAYADVNGRILWNMEQVKQLPKILGNSDPIHYVQMFPGVQTNGEYRGGINVHGCDNAHNFVSISHTPVYNVNHLLGFFSPFVASHYPYMSLQKTATSSEEQNRLGASLNMESYDPQSDTLQTRPIAGELSVGMISSQGTLHAKLSECTTLTISGRGSYINLLYNHWMSGKEDMDVNYRFGDGNLSLIQVFNPYHRVVLDAYVGQDRADITSAAALTSFNSKWGNNLQNLAWHYDNHGWKVETALYHTQYTNRFNLDLSLQKIQMPSGINTWGVRSSAIYDRLTLGGQVDYHHILIQSPQLQGPYLNTNKEGLLQNAMEASAYADWRQPIAPSIKIGVGLRTSLFSMMRDPNSRPVTFCGVDPLAGVHYEKGVWKMSATWSLRHQYITQTGVSGMGLPTDFWMASSRQRHPQYAQGIELSATTWILKRKIQLSAELYMHRLYHQLECSGTVLNLINADYDIDRMLIHGDGCNWGGNIMLSKPSGKINGWVSYSYGKARRRFREPDYPNAYPASHERPHELNIVACYAPNKHWGLSATFVCASGTPFTAPKNFYLLGNSLISQYASHNSSRLRPYIRLDISANYQWYSSKGRKQGMNISLYNATARNNELFYYLSINKNKFVYKPVGFFAQILPSINYFINF